MHWLELFRVDFNNVWNDSRSTGFRVSRSGRDTLCWNKPWIRNTPNRQTSACFITERPQIYARKSTRTASTAASVGETVRLRSPCAHDLTPTDPFTILTRHMCSVLKRSITAKAPTSLERPGTPARTSTPTLTTKSWSTSTEREWWRARCVKAEKAWRSRIRSTLQTRRPDCTTAP